MHGRTLAGVQHAGLYKYVVDGKTHLSAQRIQLAYKMALRGAADGGIAGHHGQRVQIQGGQKGAQSKTRTGKRGFAARMARADNDNVKIVLDQSIFTSRKRIGLFKNIPYLFYYT